MRRLTGNQDNYFRLSNTCVKEEKWKPKALQNTIEYVSSINYFTIITIETRRKNYDEK